MKSDMNGLRNKKSRLYVLLFLLVVVFSINFSLAVVLPEDYTCADKPGSECDGGAGCNPLAIDYLEINPGASEETIASVMENECKCEGPISCGYIEEMRGECVPGGYLPICPDKCTFIEDSDCGDGVIQNEKWRFFDIEGQEQCDLKWNDNYQSQPSIRNSTYWYEQGCVPPYDTDENGDPVDEGCVEKGTGEYECRGSDHGRIYYFPRPAGGCPKGTISEEKTITVCPPQEYGPAPCTLTNNPFEGSKCIEGIEFYDDTCNLGVMSSCKYGEINLLMDDCTWECTCHLNAEDEILPYANGVSVTPCSSKFRTYRNSFSHSAGLNENLDSCVLSLRLHSAYFMNASVTIDGLRVIDYNGNTIYSKDDISYTVKLDGNNEYFEKAYAINFTSVKEDPVALTCVFDLSDIKGNGEDNVCLGDCNAYGTRVGDFDGDDFYSFAQARALNNSEVNCSGFNVNVEGEDDWPFDDKWGQLYGGDGSNKDSGPSCKEFDKINCFLDSNADGLSDYNLCAKCRNYISTCSVNETKKYIEKCESGSETGYWLRGVGWMPGAKTISWQLAHQYPNWISSLSCDSFISFSPSLTRDGFTNSNRGESHGIETSEYLTLDAFIRLVLQIESDYRIEKGSNIKSEDLAMSIFLTYYTYTLKYYQDLAYDKQIINNINLKEDYSGASVADKFLRFQKGVGWPYAMRLAEQQPVYFYEIITNFILRHPEFHSAENFKYIHLLANGSIAPLRPSSSSVLTPPHAYAVHLGMKGDANGGGDCVIKRVYYNGKVYSMSHVMLGALTTPLFVWGDNYLWGGKGQQNINGNLFGLALRKYISPQNAVIMAAGAASTVVYVTNPNYTPLLSEALVRVKLFEDVSSGAKALSSEQLEAYEKFKNMGGRD